MKVTWEPEDIRPGRRVRKPWTDEVRLIGYCQLPTELNLALVSLHDGAVMTFDTREAVVSQLNAGGYQPVELIGEKD